MSQITESVKRISMFLPPDIKLNIFNSLLEHFKNRKITAKNIGCSHKSLLRWLVEKKIDDKYFPKILALSLQLLPQTSSLLKKHLVDELKDLCMNLAILKDEEKSKLNLFMKTLNEKDKAIIMYLWRNRHGKIREISNLINAPTDTHTLSRIREVINPIAKNILGKQIMRFEESKIDYITGEKILFSWWLADEIELIERQKEVLDIFNEKDHLKIITGLPNVNEKDIRIDMDKDALVISVNTSDCAINKRVPLFYAVKKIAHKTYKNGILAIKLKKIER